MLKIYEAPLGLLFFMVFFRGLDNDLWRSE
jgi:hypothetical protein